MKALARSLAKQREQVSQGQGDKITARHLKTLVEQAAADTFGGNITPEIYSIVSTSLEVTNWEGYRHQLANASLGYIRTYFRDTTDRQAFVFLSFLVDSELFLDSRRIRVGLAEYVNAGLENTTISPSVIHAATHLIHYGRDPVDAYVEGWFVRFRSFFLRSPTWDMYDVLLELYGKVNEYSVGNLMNDLRKLRAHNGLEDMVHGRESVWREKLNKFPEEILTEIKETGAHLHNDAVYLRNIDRLKYNLIGTYASSEKYDNGGQN